AQGKDQVAPRMADRGEAPSPRSSTHAAATRQDFPMTYLAQRITSGSRKSYGMYAKAAALETSGRDLIHMELGSPHADTPLPVKQATVGALMAGNVHYSHFQGLPKLRAALAGKLRTKNGLDVDASGIVVTNGL